MDTEVRNTIREELLNLREASLKRWFTFIGLGFTVMGLGFTAVSVTLAGVNIYVSARAAVENRDRTVAEIRGRENAVKEKELAAVPAVRSESPARDFQGSLPQGQSWDVDIDLSPGDHLFEATCEGCEDLDLAVSSESDNEVLDEDVLLDALPIANFRLRAPETVRVRVRMIDCPIRSCRWEMRRYVGP